MFPVSFDLTAALRCAAFIAAIGFAWFIFDAIGDAREAKVWAELNAAIRKTNADIADEMKLDDKLAQISEAARSKALASAKSLPAVASSCPASKAQADALSAIH